ncbi:MAG: ATP-binding protein [Promethearchaeota archaeon]
MESEIQVVPSCQSNAISVKIYINQSRCIGYDRCGICIEVCPFGLPTPNFIGILEIPRPDLCTECSACKKNCPSAAIIMQERKGCGCLWDVKARQKKGSKNSCGEGSSSSSCC